MALHLHLSHHVHAVAREELGPPAELLEAAQLERVGLFAPELIVGLTTTKGSTAVAVGTDRASMLAREVMSAELVTRSIHPLYHLPVTTPRYGYIHSPPLRPTRNRAL